MKEPRQLHTSPDLACLLKVHLGCPSFSHPSINKSPLSGICRAKRTTSLPSAPLKLEHACRLSRGGLQAFFSAIVLFTNRSPCPPGFWWFSRKIRIPETTLRALEPFFTAQDFQWGLNPGLLNLPEGLQLKDGVRKLPIRGGSYPEKEWGSFARKNEIGSYP